MATLREYFDTDFPFDWKIFSKAHSEQNDLEITICVHIQMEAGAKFISLFVPAMENMLENCCGILSLVPEIYQMKNMQGFIVPKNDPSHVGFKASWGKRDDIMTFTYRMHDLYNFQVEIDALHNSKFVFLYVEHDVSFEEWKYLQQFAISNGFFVRIRDFSYVRERSKDNKPVAFISHDQRDKDLYARPLAVALRQRSLVVWFDEFSLQPGDRLKTSIDEGIRSCEKCIVLLTQNYLSNNRWASYELDSAIMREICNGENIIIPVWIGVNQAQVYQFNPQITNIVAVTWQDNEQKVADALARVLF
jgi:hypothetical protein